MTAPAFSVLIPVFNGSAHLSSCLESVARQTCTDWECIIADDGSSDESLDIAAAWRDRMGARVRIVRHPRGAHRGLPLTRNLSALHATGRWLAFIDHDDDWHPEKLDRQREYLLSHDNVDAVGCLPWFICDESTALPVWVEVWRRMISDACEPDGRIPFDRFLVGCPFVISGAVVTREAFGSAGGFDAALSHTCDWLLWASLASRRPLGMIRVPLVGYRVHGDSMMGQRSHEPFAMLAACFDLHARLIPWLARDRHIPLTAAESLVNEGLDWTRAAREGGIDLATWCELMAGR
jgi:glycosyltransferase involved in cell wall biosynthesis